MKSVTRWAFVLLLVADNVLAAVRYVNVNNSAPAPPYTNWATAAPTIQQAVDAAVAGDEILVTNGVYHDGGRMASEWGLKNRVAVDKPLALRSVNGPTVTIIQGYQVPGTIFGSTAVRCVYLTNGAALVGFTLTNGATGGFNLRHDLEGGGVWCESTNAVLSNCVLIANSARSGGGAYGGTLINCTLSSNSADSVGGGAAAGTLINCTLNSNSAFAFGGGAYGCTVNNCTLSGNSGSSGLSLGGGAFGGTLNNCTLIGNSARSAGGAYGCTLNNCTLTGNSAGFGGTGGGAYDCTLNNCTLTGNFATTGGGVYRGTLNNCIVYFNNAQNHIESTLNYCCTTALSGIGEGNITNAPLFIAQACGNFRLQPNSPCINAGNNADVVGSTDLDGNPRIIGGIVDIGAYEFQGAGILGDVLYAFTNFAGLPGVSGTNDGARDGARFYIPEGVAVDTAGNVYVADSFNNTIRKITPGGVVTTLAGSPGQPGSANGTGSAARFGFPNGVAVDSAGNVYVADSGNYTIRRITPGAVVTTLAGSPGQPGSADGTESTARFGRTENGSGPYGVAVDNSATIYVADTGNSTIRKITPAGVVTTLAGSAGQTGNTDGTGGAARFYRPQGVAIDSAGNVYVADSGNYTIRRITPGAVVTTLAGSPGQPGSADGTGSTARFYNPSGVAVDSVGNIYVVDNSGPLRKVSPTGVVTTMAGSCERGSADGIGTAALFNGTEGVAVDSAGNVYVADTFNHRISKGTRVGASVSPLLDRIVVGGPSTVSAASGTSFTCTASYSSGSAGDVSTLASWQIVSSAPAGTYLQGNTLFAGNTTVDTIVYLSARYSEGGVTVTSDPFPVTIKPAGLKVSITQAVDFQNAFPYGRVLLSAKVTGASGPVGYLWNLPGASQRGPIGAADTWAVYDQRATYSARVTASDDNRTATGSAYVSVTSRPVTDQPPGVPPVDPAPGQLRSWSNPSQPVAFDADWQGRINRGLIVIAHGLHSSATKGWPMGMASAIRDKLGNSCPNIVLFDWENEANPLKWEQYKSVLQELAEYGGQDWSALGDAISIVDFAADCLLIRFVNSQPQGIHLATWISSNIASGNINPAAPIQIIGHSAGGFVAGESALVLRNIATCQVTMLDTPVPYRSHVRNFPNPGKVERYISSFVGQLCLDFLTPGPSIFPTDDDVNLGCALVGALCTATHVPGSACSFTCNSLTRVSTSAYYHRSIVYPNILLRTLFIPSQHEQGHEWYTTSVFSGEADGFYYSPWRSNPLPVSPLPLAPKGPLPDPPGESEEPLGGFSTFGSVTLTNGVYQLTEAADAGIFKTVALPAGTEALKFKYRFTVPGDGDFLSVHWGSNVVVYRGPDVQLTRSNLLEAEVQIAGFAGRTNTLTFTLVSRGNPNATVAVQDIRIVVNSDADQDGLDNAQELALGTDPQRSDTDGDGLSDGDEVNDYHTNPLLADTDGDGVKDGQEVLAGTDPTKAASVFKITSVRVNPDQTVTLEWQGSTNRTYRVHQTVALPPTRYLTLTNGLPARFPVSTFTMPQATNSTHFFWIEAE